MSKKTKYIDVHCHIGSTIVRDPIVGQTTGLCLARMAQTDIHAAIIGPTAVGSPQERGLLDTYDQNRIVAQACKLMPDRFPVGLALIELRHGRAGVEALERTLVNDGLQGIMWHPAGGVPHARLFPFLEVASLVNGLCLLHTNAKDTALLAKRFPLLTFLAHAGDELLLEVCGGLENVCFEIAQRPGGPSSNWDFRKLIDQFGSDRLVFAGDLPYYDYRVLQRSLESAAISDAERNAIAHGNAIRLIRQFKPEWKMPETPTIAPQRYTEEEMWARNGERLTVFVQ